MENFWIKSPEQLLKLKPSEVTELLSQEELIHWFDMMNAHWIYPCKPDPCIPHAELTSGLCSNGFFDVLKVLKYINLSDIFAKLMVWKVVNEFGNNVLDADIAVGSPMAAVTIAHDFAREAGIPVSGFTEKDPKNPKSLIWNRDPLLPRSRVIQVEELVTTIGTTDKGKKALMEKNPDAIVSEIVSAIVYRPPNLNMETGGRKISALIRQAIVVYDPHPDTCPYCAVGSKRYRPKGHWAELNVR